MSFGLFLQSLMTDGVARVPVIHESTTDHVGAMDEVEDVEAAEALEFCERRVRLDWPGDPPALDVELAVRSAGFIYQASRLVLSRHISAKDGMKLLDHFRIDVKTPAAHYAVDVVGRYLPDLLRLAGGELSDDPIVQRLRTFGKRWPLSSVGVAEIEPEQDSLEVVLNHESLRVEYVDRVLRQNDVARLSDPAVCEWARLAVGPHHELLPVATAAALVRESSAKAEIDGE